MAETGDITICFSKSVYSFRKSRVVIALVTWLPNLALTMGADIQLDAGGQVSPETWTSRCCIAAECISQTDPGHSTVKHAFVSSARTPEYIIMLCDLRVL